MPQVELHLDGEEWMTIFQTPDEKVLELHDKPEGADLARVVFVVLSLIGKETQARKSALSQHIGRLRGARFRNV